MTDKAKWTALAERCEAAQKPDRDIDADIYELLGLAPGTGWTRHRHKPGIRNMDVGSWSGHGRIRSSPSYTASINDIKALIEWQFPQCGWGLVYPEDRTERPAATLCLKVFNGDGQGATPELALCAAFCRLKAQVAS